MHIRYFSYDRDNALTYEFEVEFTGTAGTEDSWDGPGDPPEIEIVEVTLVGCRKKGDPASIELSEHEKARAVHRLSNESDSHRINAKCVKAFGEDWSN